MSARIQRDVKANGVRLRVAETGSGPSLLLLHGLFMDHSTWDPLGDLLSREYRVVASPKVIELFLDEESQHLAGLSDFIGKPISLQSESAMGQEQYDIVLL